MKKSLVLVLVLALVSSFVFAEAGKLNVDVYNTAWYSYPSSFFPFEDDLEVKATFAADNFEVVLDGKTTLPGASFGLQGAAEYMFNYPDFDKLAVFGSIAIDNSSDLYSRVGLDVEFTSKNGVSFWAAPQVESFESFALPVTMLTEGKKVDFYCEALLSGDLFAPGLFSKGAAFAELKDFDVFAGAWVDNFDNYAAVLSLPKVLPFEATGIFSFEHPTTVSVTNFCDFEEDSNYEDMAITVGTEIFNASFDEEFFNLKLKNITLHLSGTSYRDFGTDSRGRFNAWTEFAFDSAKRNDEVKLSLGLYDIHQSDIPEFRVVLTYAPKSADNAIVTFAKEYFRTFEEGYSVSEQYGLISSEAFTR